MTRATIQRGASILLAGFLVALSPAIATAQQLPPSGNPPPDIARPDTPIPVLFLLYHAVQQARTPVAQPLTCPRHTKPRVDCTPVLQR